MPKSINSITIVITLEGIEKIKTEKKKMTEKQSKNISFTNSVRKPKQTL